MILEKLKQNVRLLERLTIFRSSLDDIPGVVPGTSEYLFLAVLQELQNGNVSAAKQQYKLLCDQLGVHPIQEDARLEPLQTLLHLKLWEGDEADRKQLQQYLIKQLGLNFEAEPPVPPVPPGLVITHVDNGGSITAAEPQQQNPQPQLPSHLKPEQYSSAAFTDLISQTGALHGGQSLVDKFDQSYMVEAVQDESLPLSERVVLLQQRNVPPAVLPVEVLVRLVSGWVATESWNHKPATDWVTSNWTEFTVEQAMAVRPVLSGPPFGSNPEIDRPYIAALVMKALAGPAAAAESDSSSSVLPWTCGAADAAAAADLARILELCGELGQPANWVRLHALHAQVQLQLQQQPNVSLNLLVNFMKLLGRAAWSEGPTVSHNPQQQQQQHVFGTQQQQQQQPMHVPCSVCGMQPIVGPRFRSTTHFGFNVCSGCFRSAQAVAASPLEEVKVDDSIYMLPHVPLPDVLGELPSSESAREALARKLLVGVVEQDGENGAPDLFTPDGACPLAAAGLLLPKEWRDAAVAEGKLLAGRGDTAAWVRLYQKHADMCDLAQRTELSFAAHNKSSYAVEDDVLLHIHTKNTGPQGVLVKLYEINCWSYYTTEGKEVDLNFDLSGVAPSKTLALPTPENPLLRTLHSIKLGLAGKPGVWLVEAVAQGQRVTCRIHKGCLRVIQEACAAGQLLTVLSEAWQPVKDVKVWCQGRQYSTSPRFQPNMVLLPYSRKEEMTTVVVSATLVTTTAAATGGGAGAGEEQCVVLLPDFLRLCEQYTLRAQLYCHQEALLPGQTVPLLLQLALQLHGSTVPLQLLQDVTLRLTAATDEGGEVKQVFRELCIDPNSRQLQLQYPQPQGAYSLRAELTAKLLLTLPGMNGEPAWQDFTINRLFPGPTGQQAALAINATAQTTAIWDMYLTTKCPSSSSSSTGDNTTSPEYVLQVLGRSGEPPAVPKALSVWLTHVGFNCDRKLHFRVQTGQRGEVILGQLWGIRQLSAQLESGVDNCSEDESAAAAADQSLAGPVRRWQIARASWWQGGLQHEYNMPVGDTLDIPLNPAAGQTLAATLLQLVDPTKASSTWRNSALHRADITADITHSHLEILPLGGEDPSAATATAAAAAGGGGGGTVASSSCTAASLGSGNTVTVRVRGLPAGVYRLVVPAVVLQAPQEGFVGPGWQSIGHPLSHNMYVHVRVLPCIAAAAAATGDAGDTIQPAQSTGAAAAAAQPDWLYSSAVPPFQGPVIYHPSPSQQLQITSLLCSVTSGLSAQLTGSPDQLAGVRLVAVFSRFLHDGTVHAAQLMNNAHVDDLYVLQGCGVSDALLNQGYQHSRIAAADAGGQKASGGEQLPQPCGDYGRCSYSTAAKLDSAVAYVLQRRQWEAAARQSGGSRPGTLLERPSLLAMPRSVRSAASATSVLRGGDGGRVKEQQQVKFGGFGGGAAAAVCYGAPCPQSAPQFAQCMAAAMPCPIAFGSTRNVAPEQADYHSKRATHAQVPVLGFLKNSAVLLAGLEPRPDGSVVVPADQLHQLLQEAAEAATGRTDRDEPGSSTSVSSSSSSRMFGPGGFTVVYVAAYSPNQPGQFSSCFAAIEGAAGPEASVRPDARRDVGLKTNVDDSAILALACTVLTLSPGQSLTLPNADACEAAAYSSTQQLYHLLAGLLEWAETGQATGLSHSGGVALQLLPRPCVPPRAEGSAAHTLLRQWEPLLLHWPGLPAAAGVELLGHLGSAEAAFYLACRDQQAYQQLVLPLLRSKQPSELCCLEQILLLQAEHGQAAVPRPSPSSSSTGRTPEDATPAAAAAAAVEAYGAAKQALLQYWFAPHRYHKLTTLEQLLLAALEGKDALLRFGKDMKQALETPEQKRGVKQSWMSSDRRALFDFAQLVCRQLQQQEQQQQQRKATDKAEAASDEEWVPTEFATDDGDDYVHVEGFAGPMAAAAAAAGGLPMAPPPPPAPMAAAPKMAKKTARLFIADDTLLAARQQQQSAAAAAAHLAPKETKEWAEAGWWKCEGQHAPAALIPPALFWADFAIHLATNPDEPFIPTDPTGAAASTAAVTAALAVVGLSCEGAAAAAVSGAAAAAVGGGSNVGCVRSYTGSTLTLTAKSACLLWVKQVQSVANIGPQSTTSDTGRSGRATGDRSSTSGAVPVGSTGSTSTVIVTHRLFDPRFPASTDPETGEQLLLSLQPSEQQPLLAGQAYCCSVVITSTSPSEQQLDMLVQVPEGSLPLAGSLSTTSISFTLAPYATKQLTSSFYFPAAGVFKQAPVSVTKRGRPAWLPSSVFPALHVVTKPLAGSAAKPHPGFVHPEFNWIRFLSSSRPSEILEYLQTGDLSLASLVDLSPYCRDPAFFAAAVTALNHRHVFEYNIWKWAVVHMDGKALQQLLPMSMLGKRLAVYGVPVSSMLQLLPLSSSDVGLQHLEYWPWVNPYCRPIPRADGGDAHLPSVLADNPAIAQQWTNFLLAALFDSYARSSSSDGSSGSGSSNLSLARAAAAACYLLLQDRIDDADQILSEVDLEAAAAALHDGDPLRMQVDYLRAYMMLIRPLSPAATAAAGDSRMDQHAAGAAVDVVKEVVDRYKGISAQPWRKRFAQLAGMLAEVEQQQPQPAASPSCMAAAAAAGDAPSDVMLSVVSFNDSKLKVACRNIDYVTLFAYQIDIELLFTSQPFSSLALLAATRASSNGSSSNCTTAAAACPLRSKRELNVMTGSSSSSDDTSGLGKLAYVQPNAKVVVQLPHHSQQQLLVSSSSTAAAAAAAAAAVVSQAADAGGVIGCELDLDLLMPDLASTSVLIEVVGGGVSRTLPRFASKLSVQVYERQGVLQAFYHAPQLSSGSSSSSSQRQVPAAAVYVKVFAKDKSGDVWFYKDGFTDLRGKFDYVTLTSTADMSRVTCYSILVAAAELGAVITQAAAAPRA